MDYQKVQIRRAGIAALLSLITGAAAGQQVLNCDITDHPCLDRATEIPCLHEGATERACLAVAELLELTLEESYTVSLGKALAVVNMHLATNYSPPRSASASAYLDNARALLMEVIERDPTDAIAYLGFARIAELEGEDRIHWLREAAAANDEPIYTRFLASALENEVGGFDAHLESARLTERLYDRQEIGPNKWQTGGNTWVKFIGLKEEYPDRVGEPLSATFAHRVREDAKLDALLQLLQEPENSPLQVSDALELICFDPILGIFGFDDCIERIEAVVTAALSEPDTDDRDLLIRAAVNGMSAAANWRIPFARPDWRGIYDDWFERLLSAADTTDTLIELHLARANLAGNSPARLDALVSALEVSPNNADLHLKLGTAYLDQRMWRDAREHLIVARRLAPAEDYARIDNFLRIAGDGLIEN